MNWATSPNCSLEMAAWYFEYFKTGVPYPFKGFDVDNDDDFCKEVVITMSNTIQDDSWAIFKVEQELPLLKDHIEVFTARRASSDGYAHNLCRKFAARLISSLDTIL